MRYVVQPYEDVGWEVVDTHEYEAIALFYQEKDAKDYLAWRTNRDFWMERDREDATDTTVHN